MKLNPVLALSLFTLLGSLVACASPPGGESVVSDSDLAAPPHVVCTDDWLPVCGADGKTYSNACRARAAGQTVVSLGECPVAEPPCGGNLQVLCQQDQFCDFTASASCGRTDAGTCRPKPELCTHEMRRVCGCDGITYSNRCNANARGVSVLADGPCEA